jgi:hypothetical protein
MTGALDSTVRLSMALELASIGKSFILENVGHKVSDPSARLDTPAGAKSPQQVAWFLEHDRWEDEVVEACAVAGCLTHLKLKGADIEEAEDKDDPLLKLVERTSVTLADLYRKGRAKGLLAPRSDYK